VDIAATLSTLSLVRLQTGDAAGAEVGEREALQIFKQLGDRVGEAIGLLHLGQIANYRGELDAARTLLEQCLAVARDIKSIDIEGECELHLGEAAFDAGLPDKAAQHFKRSLIVCREGGDKRGEANALWHLGQIDLQGADVASARARLAESLQSFNAFGMRAELLGCLEDCAALARLEMRKDDAARLGGAIDIARERLNLKRAPRAEERWSMQLAALQGVLPAAEFESARDEGRQWQIDDAVRGALATPAAEAVTA
jgi:tetratricopeptide (TPR) repeat protein